MSRHQIRRRPVITEATLRRIIRDELARQHLMREGITDVLKAPFKRLSEKARKLIAEKSEEILQKLKDVAGQLGDTSQYKKFFDTFEKEEGGMSFDQLVSSIPEYAELKSEAETASSLDAMKLLASGASSSTKNESITYDDFRMSVILAEESYAQRSALMSRALLAESVVGTIAAAWWTATKTIVAVCGLISFVLSVAVKVCKYLGFKKAASVLEKVEHFVEHSEDLFLDKVAFPKPVQYAAYRAMWLVKGISGEVRTGMPRVKSLDFKQFMSEEGKEERAAALKALHLAVVSVLVVEALAHIAHAVKELFQTVSGVLTHGSSLSSAASHAAAEVTSFSKVGRTAATAAGEMAAAGSQASRTV